MTVAGRNWVHLNRLAVVPSCREFIAPITLPARTSDGFAGIAVGAGDAHDVNVAHEGDAADDAQTLILLTMLL